MPAPTVETDYVILRKTPFQDSSLIVSGISSGFGRLDFLLKGARNVRRRQFPEAELFREFHVIFREAKSAEGLSSMVSCDPAGRHDGIAEKPDHYLSACTFAAFLLRNTKPMLAVPDTYRAFSVLLSRLERETESEPWISLAKFAFLHENGFVPQSGDGGDAEEESGHGASVRKLMTLALDPEHVLPPDNKGFWRRFKIWIDNLSAWNGLEKASPQRS